MRMWHLLYPVLEEQQSPEQPSASAAGTPDQVTVQPDGKEQNNSSKPQVKFRCLRRLCKGVIAALVLIVCILPAVLFYLLGTTAGARQALSVAQYFTRDLLTLQGEITDGTVWSGLKLKDFNLEIPDTIGVSADHIALSYELLPVITERDFAVNAIEADKLTVALLIPDTPDKEQPEPEEPAPVADSTPFRLHFPVNIEVQKLQVRDFAYLSSIVDVKVNDLTAALSAADDATGMQHARAQGVRVELKNSAGPEQAKEAENTATADTDTAEPEAVQEVESLEHEAQRLITTFDDGHGLIAEMPTVHLPLDIVVEDFQARDVFYTQEGFNTGDVKSVALSATWYDTRLEVQNLSAVHAMGQTQVHGSMDFKNFFYLDFDLTGEGYKNAQTLSFLDGLLYGLKGEVSVQGSLVDLTARANLQQPEDTDLYVRLNCLSPQLPAEVKVSTKEFAYPIIDNFKEEHAAEPAGAVTAAAGAPKTAVQKTEENVAGADADSGPSFLLRDFDLQAQGNLQEGFVSSLHGVFSGFGFDNYAADFDGLVALDHAVIDRLQLQGVYQKAKVSLQAQGNADYGATTGFNGSFSFKASDAAFLTTMLKGAVSGEGELAVSVTLPDDSKGQELSVAFDVDSLDSLFHLNGVSSDLKIQQASGRYPGPAYVQLLTFRQGENHVKATGYLAGLSTAEAEHQGDAAEQERHTAQAAAVLGTAVASHKASYAGAGSSSADDEDDDLSDTADLEDDEKADTVYTARRSAAAPAAQTAALSGQDEPWWKHSSALNGIIELPRLDLLLPSLKGDFSASFNATGRAGSVNLNITGRSRRLVSGDVRLQNLAFDAGLSQAQESFAVTAVAQTIRIAKGLKPSRQCVLDLSGTLRRHALSFMCGGASSTMLSASGSFDKQDLRWQGSLDEFYFTSPVSGNLALADAVDIEFNAGSNSGRVAPFAIRSGAGSMQAGETKWHGSDFSTSLSLDNVDLKSLNDLLPQGMHMSGTVQMDSTLKMAGGVPDVHVSLQAPGARFFAQNVPLFFDDLSLEMNVQREKAQVDLLAALSRDRGKVDVQLEVLQPLRKRLLAGHASVQALDLSLFMGAGAMFNDLQGKADLSGDFGGSLQQPLFFGSLHTAGSAEPRYDVGQVNSFDMTLKANGSSGALTGQIELNEGILNLDGELDWSEGAYGMLQATAHELPVFLTGYGQAYANLDSKVTFDKSFSASGKIDIPRARVVVKSLGSSAVAPSPDEIIVPEGGTSELMANVSAPVPAEVNLEVGFGDDVRLSAMGLEAGIAGQLNLSKGLTDSNLSARGRVELVDGNADLYGHHFIVNRARALFHGEIANPALDVEVVADPEELEDNVQAGVRVTGDVQNPEVALFSRPSMSQNEVLSYLLYGHGLDKTSALQDSTSNSSMLMGLGVSSASGLVNAVVGAFGVQNVQVQAAGSGDDTQVQVQGYLTRKIRVSYGYGVFNAVGEFKLRYEFVRRLYAEFISSVDQAVDLVYSFEFD